MEDMETARDDPTSSKLSRIATNHSIAETLSPLREFLFIGLITCAQFTTQAALGQTISIIHIIGDHYSLTNPGQLSWLIAGYSLTVGSFILISGRLGDLFGYKRLLLLGYAWFALTSLMSGLAVYSNHVLFIFARVLTGIGPAICLPNAIALLGATYAPGRRKSMVFGIFGASAPGGSVAGSLFAALFALTWWPWAFWSMAIALAMIAVVGIWVIPDTPRTSKPPSSIRELCARCDLLGCTAGVLALVLVNFAWNQAGVVGWAQPYVYVCLILGVVCVPLFFYIETMVASSPLIPFDAFNSEVAFVLACLACGWGTFGIWFYYYWQELLVVRQLSPLLANAYISPVAITGTLAGVMTGYLLTKVRPAWLMLVALLAFLTGSILLATVPIDQIYWGQLFFAVVVAPIGMDCSFPAATLILSNAVQKEHQGIAASLVATIVNYSISLSLGFAGTVEMNVSPGQDTREHILVGYRSALYVGIGLAGLGVFLSAVFVAKTHIDERRRT